ncbi:MAG: translational GTPase TypA [Candidatus Midichloria mitochondrii]|uniref:Large ribosomal subunit assembly factor BipA n=1 Tax=Midichloria mitochondrii (strain IricVA) TaxID=696127 RepID=F7XUF2_MIDMI|nr:translational GTPase TypA [Candidatus Midichloria mitochondrii]AEI89511.1 GTP binding protein typA [Candidatus Midichloria mitochondrii IricVA]MDJ1256662.1 translational GTPase TypA [Candidatus Midichloria mitochondrii]MDJ1288384.1 translational GTPase TypA [Candidatus Midichloria mitochondrii]MDJ1299224.1 translational GTPase TypA [Candidatus Midichloria mitochondrii]MDJ1313350.1 translational GTPase TypA [Candidatus Midichloria mitochondrii]
MQFRNIAVIAHVDHGKTTLIDQMLKQSGIFRSNQVIAERAMDSGELEKERGITIIAKCTSFFYEGIKFNIVDTPGHADFGGEVERVLSMVDGVVLLVDASEGPMPQTKFVLMKALKLGLKPIVIINKVDRPDRRINEVLNEIFDLFVSLDATNEQLDFSVLYASGRSGWATTEAEIQGGVDLKPLFEAIKNHIPEPKVDKESPFKMLASILTHDQYVGRVLIGKVYSGSAAIGTAVKSISLSGEVIESTKLTRLFGFQGIERINIEKAEAGDIVAIAGVVKSSVSDTICIPSVNEPITSTPIDPPTMAVTISVNDSPLAGQEGSKVTSRMILNRLEKEAQTNVAITLKISASGEAFEVGGRGELQLGVLIETMRREGFELSVSKPRVLFKEGEDGSRLEPIEEVVIDVDEEYSGIVVEKLSIRKGEMLEIKHSGSGKLRLVFLVPSRGLIGYQSEFRNDTRGTGVLSRLFNSYQKYKGEITTRHNGVLISNSDGEAVAYALWNLEERGTLFIHPKTKVYQGMIIGEHNRDNDLEVNPIKGKQLTNMRAAGSDENTKLTPPRVFTLEEVISYIKDDELVEVTPKNIRLRKHHLCPHERKRESRKSDK